MPISALHLGAYCSKLQLILLRNRQPSAILWCFHTVCILHELKFFTENLFLLFENDHYYVA